MDHNQKDADTFSLPGCKIRHLIEFHTCNWDEVLNLLNWINRRSGEIAFVKSHQVTSGELKVALGVEAMSASDLKEELYGNDAMRFPSIEHLLMKDDASRTAQ